VEQSVSPNAAQAVALHLLLCMSTYYA